MEPCGTFGGSLQNSVQPFEALYQGRPGSHSPRRTSSNPNGPHEPYLAESGRTLVKPWWNWWNAGGWNPRGTLPQTTLDHPATLSEPHLKPRTTPQPLQNLVKAWWTPWWDVEPYLKPPRTTPLQNRSGKTLVQMGWKSRGTLLQNLVQTLVALVEPWWNPRGTSRKTLPQTTPDHPAQPW